MDRDHDEDDNVKEHDNYHVNIDFCDQEGYDYGVEMPGKRGQCWSPAGGEVEGAKSFCCPPPVITFELVDRPTQLICIWIFIDILASHLRLLSYPSKLR